MLLHNRGRSTFSDTPHPLTHGFRWRVSRRLHHLKLTSDWLTTTASAARAVIETARIMNRYKRSIHNRSLDLEDLQPKQAALKTPNNDKPTKSAFLLSSHWLSFPFANQSPKLWTTKTMFSIHRPCPYQKRTRWCQHLNL